MVSVFKRTVNKFQERAFVSRNLAADQQRNTTELKKCLNYWDLLVMGVGAMVGAGVFVLTGSTARDMAGPGVIMSYMISAFVAGITAMCYSEFAVDLPLAGSAFNYVSQVFGEFLAWVAAIEMLMEYTLSSGAVSKGCSGYFATLIGLDSKALVWEFGFLVVDPVAFTIVIALSLLLMFGIRESSTVNIVVTSINIAVVLFILGMSFPRINTDNYSPFIPKEFGITGVFSAASVLFFSYVGFDALATVAEEVQKPSRDIPVGMIGALIGTTVLYAGMAASITGMLPYQDIDDTAPFAVVFSDRGLGWVATIVSLGAVTGTLTAALVMLLGQTRIHLVLARQHLTPKLLAKINPKWQTPVNATILTMITVSLPALLLDINLLASMVSMGSLSTMAMVCLGIIFRSYYEKGAGESVWPVSVRLILIILFSVLEGLAAEYKWGIVAVSILLGLWFLATISLYFLPVVYRSPHFNVPFKPIVPSMGVLACIHLICALGKDAYIRFGIWQALGLLFYFGYSLQQDRPSQPQLDAPSLTTQLMDAGDDTVEKLDKTPL